MSVRTSVNATINTCSGYRILIICTWWTKDEEREKKTLDRHVKSCAGHELELHMRQRKRNEYETMHKGVLERGV